MVDHVVTCQRIERNAGIRRQIDQQGFLLAGSGDVARRIGSGNADGNLWIRQHIGGADRDLVAQFAVIQRNHAAVDLLPVDRDGHRIADLRVTADRAADGGGGVQRFSVVDHVVTCQRVERNAGVRRQIDLQGFLLAGGGGIARRIGGGNADANILICQHIGGADRDLVTQFAVIQNDNLPAGQLPVNGHADRVTHLRVAADGAADGGGGGE